jgi:hypothetical protein
VRGRRGARMKTIKELIAELDKIKDKEQPVLSYYWLHDDFEFIDFDEDDQKYYGATREQFRKLEEKPYLSSVDYGYEQLSNQISDTLHDIIKEN